MSRKSTLVKKNVLEICSDERLNHTEGPGKDSWKKGNINWALKNDDLKGSGKNGNTPDQPIQHQHHCTEQKKHSALSKCLAHTFVRWN